MAVHTFGCEPPRRVLLNSHDNEAGQSPASRLNFPPEYLPQKV